MVSAVELTNVSKLFGSLKAVNNISFQVSPGEVIAFLGPNGAGKTTTISLMLGLRRPDSGTARIFGLDPQETKARERIGVMLQDSDVPNTLKVSEALELVAGYYPKPLTVAKALEMADLSSKASSICSGLSGGQKKRLCFALSVIGNPDILFLDEPTAALDVEARRSFWEQVSEFSKKGKTIVLTTHYLEEADALAERIVVINQGSIVAQGSPAQIKTSVGGKIIRFKLSIPVLLENLASVTRQNQVGEITELYTLEPERVLRELFNRNLEFTDLEVRGSGLEEAFVALTAKAQA